MVGRIVIDCANGAAFKVAPAVLWDPGTMMITNVVEKIAGGAPSSKPPSAAERLGPQLPRPENAQHRHVAGIGISARIGIHDKDNPMLLG